MSKRSAPKDSGGRITKLLKTIDNENDDSIDGGSINDGSLNLHSFI